MESKEEISDTDSGIILHYGPDSPTTVTKDVSTHTRAVKLKRQSLQDRLELCILELKKLCIREAELTGRLSSDYPVLPGEKPPQIRRRIGAAFKLDEQSILIREENSELSSVEAKLALQQQIYVAACRLSQEEHLNKTVKRSRVQQCKREEQKLQDLHEAVFRLRLEHGHNSPRPGIVMVKHQGTSEDSSLSDLAVLDEELTSQSSQASSEPPPVIEAYSVAPGLSCCSVPPTGPLLYPPEPSFHHSSLEHSHQSPPPVYDPAPIQNSPWEESSLDQPYQKKKKNRSNTASSSPATTTTLPPLEVCLEEPDLKLQMLKHTALRHAKSSSTPSTPEMHLRTERFLSPATTPTLPPLEVCLEEPDLKLQMLKHTALRHTKSISTPSTPEMHLRTERFLRVPNSEPPNNTERDRGRSRGPRRRLTDVISTQPVYSSVTLTNRFPLYYSGSDDSSSEHSSTSSYISSSTKEPSAELERLCQAQYTYHYPNYISQSYLPPSYNIQQNPSPQPPSSFYRGYADEGRSPYMDMDMERIYFGHQFPTPHTNGHGYDEAPLQPQAHRPIPSHLKLSRAPSLRDYPQHPSRALPRQVVSDELKSWHQRCQLRPRRPCSLDRHRQGAVLNVPGRESPLSQQHGFHKQVHQGQLTQRDGTPVKWYEEDKEIVSQV
ncbi:innate immunity activator b isoform X2 [Trichomycterus rosablanca]|uniref:innate immunity activator b isoform X2 n=1 Tax=Trichomycterus rosablanca TaxID=2290929 RepID=UPI002F35F311